MNRFTVHDPSKYCKIFIHHVLYGHDKDRYLIGKKFAYFTVLYRTKNRLWECVCDCGNKRNIPTGDLPYRNSCGCKRRKLKSNEERFCEKFTISDGCWAWKGYINPQTGYGQISINKKLISSHRASWTFNVGEIPKGAHICHTCDNRLCVNPEHLYVGNAKTNSQDRIRRNRSNLPKGEKWHKRKKWWIKDL